MDQNTQLAQAYAASVAGCSIRYDLSRAAIHDQTLGGTTSVLVPQPRIAHSHLPTHITHLYVRELTNTRY
jgi:hypothetical protein